MKFWTEFGAAVRFISKVNELPLVSATVAVVTVAGTSTHSPSIASPPPSPLHATSATVPTMAASAFRRPSAPPHCRILIALSPFAGPDPAQYA